MSEERRNPSARPPRPSRNRGLPVLKRYSHSFTSQATKLFVSARRLGQRERLVQVLHPPGQRAGRLHVLAGPIVLGGPGLLVSLAQGICLGGDRFGRAAHAGHLVADALEDGAAIGQFLDELLGAGPEQLRASEPRKAQRSGLRRVASLASHLEYVVIVVAAELHHPLP